MFSDTEAFDGIFPSLDKEQSTEETWRVFVSSTNLRHTNLSLQSKPSSSSFKQLQDYLIKCKLILQ